MRTRLVITVFIFLVALLLPRVGNLRCAEVVGLGIPPHYELLYSDLVLRGILRSASYEYPPTRDIRPDLGAPYNAMSVQIIRVRIEVTEVVKGTYESGMIDVLVHGESAVLELFEPDTDIIVGLDLRKDILGGSYFLVSDRGYYALSGEMWRSHGVSYRESEFLTQIEETKPVQVARMSDLIVEGTIESIREYESWPVADRLAVVQEVTLRVDHVKSGRDVPPKLVIETITRGTYWPKWRQPIPRLVAVGDHWYVFLRRVGNAYRVVGGVNGCFEVVNDQLVYNDDIVFPVTRKQLDQVVQSVSHKER